MLRPDFRLHVVESERRRVAKELHDEVLPSLARLTRRVCQGDCPQSQALLVDALYGAGTILRDFLGDLHPVDLEELGLVPALRNLCSRYCRLTGLCYLFEEQVEDLPLSPSRQLGIYRAVQVLLRAFGRSGNDILVVSCRRIEDTGFVTLRSVDRRVEASDWFSSEEVSLSELSQWCQIASAECEMGILQPDGFPFDLVLSFALLDDLEDVNPDAAFANGVRAFLEREAERALLSAELGRRLNSQLDYARKLASQLESSELACRVAERIDAVCLEISRVFSGDAPPVLLAAGLGDALASLVHWFQESSGIESEFFRTAAVQEPELSAGTNLALYRVVQESLNNIEKHSRASRARVTMSSTAGGLTIAIEDNGTGLSDGRQTLSRGLKNIKARATEIGAGVIWEKTLSPDVGTRVVVSLPAKRDQVTGKEYQAGREHPADRDHSTIALGSTPGS